MIDTKRKSYSGCIAAVFVGISLALASQSVGAEKFDDIEIRTFVGPRCPSAPPPPLGSDEPLAGEAKIKSVEAVAVAVLTAGARVIIDTFFERANEELKEIGEDDQKSLVSNATDATLYTINKEDGKVGLIESGEKLSCIVVIAGVFGESRNEEILFEKPLEFDWEKEASTFEDVVTKFYKESPIKLQKISYYYEGIVEYDKLYQYARIKNQVYFNNFHFGRWFPENKNCRQGLNTRKQYSNAHEDVASALFLSVQGAGSDGSTILGSALDFGAFGAAQGCSYRDRNSGKQMGRRLLAGPEDFRLGVIPAKNGSGLPKGGRKVPELSAWHRLPELSKSALRNAAFVKGDKIAAYPVSVSAKIVETKKASDLAVLVSKMAIEGSSAAKTETTNLIEAFIKENFGGGN